MPNKLPIEDYPDLLKAYGCAMAWINMVDFQLNLAIRVKGKFLTADYSVVKKIFDDMLFGRKIALTENLFDSTLRKNLDNLNKRRLFLAHGISGEEVPASNPQNRTGKIVISHKHKEEVLNIDYLEATVTLARQISQQLHDLTAATQ